MMFRYLGLSSNSVFILYVPKNVHLSEVLGGRGGKNDGEAEDDDS